MTVSSNWYQNFFSGPILDFQRVMFSAKQTEADVALIEQLASLKPGAAVLDVPCGGGRIAVELAARGYRVSGIDLTEELLADARSAAAARGVDVSFRRADMRDLPAEPTFDAIVCFGNSFGYFDDEGNCAFLAAVHRALRPGGVFILQTYHVVESLAKPFQPGRWFPIPKGYALHNPKWDVVASQIETEYIFIVGGQVESRSARFQMYSCREVLNRVKSAGFTSVQAIGDTADEPFALGSNALHLVARKT